MLVSYNWLKWYIPNIPDPEKLRDIFTYHLTEVESIEKLPDGDIIFDLNILPNRAHDLLSHSGVARELSGQLGTPFTDPTKTYEDIMAKKTISPTTLAVEIETSGCRRYSARIIRNIKVGPSPEWVVKHLESIGQRSINNIVDATNLVMYNCGQPAHAFDLDKLSSGKVESYKVIIKNAKEGMELPVVGRDGVVAKLISSDVVITSGEKTLGLAGVKGGRDSGISGYVAPSMSDFSGPRANSPDHEKSLIDGVATTDIVLEVANFDPISVRKTARRLGLLSDSAKRFENDLSPELCDFAMLELSALIAEMCPDAVFEEVVDVYPMRDEWQREKKIVFSSSHISNKIGISISSDDIENIFKNYNFSYLRTGDQFELTVPALRLDLVSTEDVAEEIGRIYGYDKVIPVLPQLSFVPQKNEVYEKISAIRAHLLNEGYREVMTYSFTNKGDVEVLASASDKNFLRTNLSDGIKKSYEMNKLNVPLLGVNEIKIFEIGTVFVDGKEETHVAYANKKEIKEYSINEFLNSSSDTFSGPRTNSPDHEKVSDESVYLNDKKSTNYLPLTTNFRIWSPYPFITRDIAIWVPNETKSDIIKKVLKENGGALLFIEPKLIDTFSKEDKTSYAFRLVFQSFEKTLTDNEIHDIMNKIESEISKNGWLVR